jgi:O-antigen/teichoic acid export membrane protein
MVRLRALAADQDMRRMSALTATEGSARLLSFAFYAVAARALSPHGFGVVRYTLTIVLIAFFLLQVLVKAIARELGSARGDEVATRDLIAASITLTVGLLIFTSLVCVLAGETGILGPVDVLGLIVALGGYTTFQMYYAVARGIGETFRPAAAYLGGSVVQLLVFGLLVVAGDATPRTALLTYGISSLLPILLCEIHRPVLAIWHSVSRQALRRLLHTGLPLVLGQIGFVVWNSADQIWVQLHLGTSDVGLYGAARNMSQLFIVVPTGVGVALLPRIAELRANNLGSQARRLVILSTAGVLGITALLAAVVIIERDPLLVILYGHGYGRAGGALLLQAIAMIFYSGFVTLTAAAVGWGWPRLSVVGMCVAAVTETAALACLPGRGLAVAAGAFALSIGVAFVVVLVWAATIDRG